MNIANSKMPRPERWDQPFDPDITDQDVAGLLQVAPFSEMDPEQFSPSIPLDGVLKNDCRIVDLEKGDIIVREGDYGSSIFLILFGEAIVALKSLPVSLLGRKDEKPKGWFNALSQLWTNPEHAEVRTYSAGDATDKAGDVTGERVDGGGTHVFLHDIPRVIKQGESVTLKQGEVFGEISALTRSPRSATVVANTKMRLLEIRWQGFRELLKRHDSMKQHMEALYRENSLRAHLRETELFRHLPADTISKLAEAAEFETFGNFQWNNDFRSTSKRDISERILAEPVIAAQGEYINGLILIRSGFARLSRQNGEGQQTIAYLGKGQVVGLRELVHNCKNDEQRPWLLSLRAVGYVDILRIPTAAMEALVLPLLPKDLMPAPMQSKDSVGDSDQNRRQAKRQDSIEPGLMEFLVEKRFINGSQAMMIDLDRCTRCDDCVRACASTHDNNPRFNRDGPKHDHWMVAHACMHCLDPVCMIGCPTGAIHRNEDSGTVIINDQTCIGCSTCSNSCPYDNIKMVEINDPSGLPIVDLGSGNPIVKATKCDLCSDQLGGPACQRACPHDALVRIDLTTTSAISEWSKR